MDDKQLENGHVSTFMDIISHHKIEIPVIQRDYAQGRISNRINPIRQKFLKVLIDTLKNSSKKLHLDFVYGKIEGKNQKLIFAKNKEAIENILLAVKGYADQCNIDFDPKIKVPETVNDSINSNFIPLDGQQRLTTLYLLHWYILKRIDLNNKNEVLTQLKGFSYKTRNSTKEFCEFLIGNTSTLDFNQDKSIAKIIEESPAFYSVWKRDPSVQGMLTTLDEINNILKTEDNDSLCKYWENLTENRSIAFDFLDLDEYEQTDELYVKMNARGKQLTDFEHFKSWLHEYIKSNELKISEIKWSDRIDTNWLDLFWKNKQENTFDVDGTMYNFIKSINLYEYIAISRKEPTNKNDINEKIINKELINKIRETNDDKNFISLTEYEESIFFSRESLDFTFTCLTTLSNIDLNGCHDVIKEITLFPFMGSVIKEVKLPFLLLSENLNPSLPDRVFYYAFLLFVSEGPIDLSEELAKEQLKNWMRICRNLIYNTYIQNPENFIDAIKAIKELSNHKLGIEKAILAEGFGLKFFDSQLKEEIKKLQYFKKGENWMTKIIEVENHPYFYGQIDFIFKLLDDAEDYENFEFYSNKLSNIFNNLDANNFLFQRLLLSKGDYLIQSNSKWSFCESTYGSLRARQDNWRKVFNDDEKRKYLKAVLDETPSLYISENSLPNYSTNNWEYLFISSKYTENISYLKNRLIDWQSDWDITLLEKSTFSGKHADLYSHTLFLDLKLQNILAEYVSVNNRRNDTNKPKIVIKSENDILGTIYYEPNFDIDDCVFLIESRYYSV